MAFPQNARVAVMLRWWVAATWCAALMACPTPPAATCTEQADCLDTYACVDGLCTERITGSSSGGQVGSSGGGTSSVSGIGSSSRAPSSQGGSSMTASSQGSSSSVTAASASSGVGSSSSQPGSSASAPASSSAAGSSVGVSSSLAPNSSSAPLSSSVGGGSSSSSGGTGVDVTVLGSDSGTSATQGVTVGQAVPAGQLLVVLAAAGDGVTTATVTDSASHVWLVAVHEREGDVDNAYVGIHYTTLATPLAAGSTISVTFGGTSATNQMVALAASGVGQLDQQDGAKRTTNPNVSTRGVVTSAVGLVVGVSVAGDTTPNTFTVPGTFTAASSWAVSRSSGITGYRTSAALTGTQSFNPTTSTMSDEYLSAVAVFKPGSAALPTGLSLSHTPNTRDVTVSWTAGSGTGGEDGCVLQRFSGGAWSSLRNVNCDEGATADDITLPGDGWVPTWTSMDVRLARRYDLTPQGTFPQQLTCAVTAPSANSTPNTDEDCNGSWDNATCTSYAWANTQTFNPPVSACLNDNSTATFACNAAVAGDNRYTDGVATTSTPDAVTSYNSANTTSTANDRGAVRWPSQGGGCTFQ